MQICLDATKPHIGTAASWSNRPLLKHDASILEGQTDFANPKQQSQQCHTLKRQQMQLPIHLTWVGIMMCFQTLFVQTFKFTSQGSHDPVLYLGILH